MMTDKATVEMESPVSGVVTKVAGEAGDVIAIGSMLVEIETATDVSDVSQEPAASRNRSKTKYRRRPSLFLRRQHKWLK